MAKHQQGRAALTYEQAVGRIFEFRGISGERHKFYVCKRLRFASAPLVIDLETSYEMPIFGTIHSLIPPEWKEILP